MKLLKKIFPPKIYVPALIAGIISGILNSSIGYFFITCCIVWGLLSLWDELDGLRRDINEIKDELKNKLDKF